MNAITKTVIAHLIDGDGWKKVKQGIEEVQGFDAVPMFIQTIYDGIIDGINEKFYPEFRRMLIELTDMAADAVEVDEIVDAAMEKYAKEDRERRKFRES
jgi:hypothetical protein